MKILILSFILMIGSALAQDALDGDGILPLHSHNDYAQHRILHEALEHNFKSIEADVWISKGKVKVSHWPWNFKGTLEELYLAPLQEMVNKGELKTSIEDPLLLWIDIKDIRGSIVDKMADLFEKYPMIGKEVKIILTGNKRLKRRMLENYPALAIERDENTMTKVDHKTNYSWYTLKWKKNFSWNGEGEISSEELAKLKDLVAKVHSEGRQLRFFASPANKAYWKLMKEQGVDLVDTDNIGELQRFWESLKLPPFPPFPPLFK